MAEDNSNITNNSIDDYFQSSPIGSVNKAIGNNLYGINHRQILGLVPHNKDNYGFTFFVRPQLNLQSDNIRNQRRFYPLLTENALSVQRFIRTQLDPRLMQGYSYGKHRVSPIDCPISDNSNAFIAVLTNNLNTISGWPDLTVPTFSADKGLYNETWSIADGITRNYEEFDIDANFKNTKGDPIFYMFYIWCHYQSFVYEGLLSPYPDFISENEIDYNTRIYRLVLDQQKDVVTKIAATGVSYPVSDPLGSVFDYNRDTPYNLQNKDITIRFRCHGMDAMDDILIKEFNETVEIFNPNMKDNNRGNLIKISKNTAALFNNRGYPRINPNTYELEWYVNNDNYKNRTKSFLENNLAEADVVNNDSEFQGD